MSKKQTYGLIFLVWFTLQGGLPMPAQESPGDAISRTAARCREWLFMFTDRDLYAINEEIRFCALLQTADWPDNAPVSSVLYVELLSPSGESVSRGKFRISEKRCSGSLSIPSSLLSGSYCLRAYTRWMRNWGPEDFYHVPLRIFNPFQGTVAGAKEEGQTGRPWADIPVRQMIRVRPSRASYTRGAQVEVLCRLEGTPVQTVPFAALTVVPEGAMDTVSLFQEVTRGTSEPAGFRLNYLPEPEGIALSGTVRLQEKDEPPGNLPVLFAVSGPEAACFAARSDTSGRYIVKLPPYWGSREICVVPWKQAGEAVRVHIDQDFSSTALPFAPRPFHLTGEERKLAARISLHMQLANVYHDGQNNAVPLPASMSVPFYGEPDFSVRVDEYVSLPNMEEVIGNLIPETFVREKHGRRSIYISSENPMVDGYAPLILVDDIPVPDVEQILAIPPSAVESMEVVRQVYVLGDTRYGGILRIRSKAGDLAGIRLAEGSYFFDYEGFSAPSSPETHPEEEGGSIPDTRNTIYWNDRAGLNAEGSFEARFKAPAIPGEYLILYRGISGEGKPVYGLGKLTVLNP